MIGSLPANFSESIPVQPLGIFRPCHSWAYAVWYFSVLLCVLHFYLSTILAVSRWTLSRQAHTQYSSSGLTLTSHTGLNNLVTLNHTPEGCSKAPFFGQNYCTVQPNFISKPSPPLDPWDAGSRSLKPSFFLLQSTEELVRRRKLSRLVTSSIP